MNEDSTQDHSAPVVPSAEAAEIVENSTTDAAAIRDAAAHTDAAPEQPEEVTALPAPAPVAGQPVSEHAVTAPAQSAPAQQPAAPAQQPAAPAQPAGAQGHELPQVFASPAASVPPVSVPAVSVPPAQGSAPIVPPVPLGAAAQATHAPTASSPGAAFGLHAVGPNQPTPQNQPTQPLGDATPFEFSGGVIAGNDKEQKSRGGVKFAAIVVAAALVGGVAGFGGGAIWNGLGGNSPTGIASGPETVTVNNPGSVNETTAIATQALPSVVTIEVSGTNEGGSGSGIIISDDGYVLTNTHVVTLGGAAADPAIRVTTADGRIYDAKVVGTDPIYDLAVIKLVDAKGLTPMEFADSSKINVGDTAVALGAPLGLANSVTTGIVSALNRSIQIQSAALPESTTEDAPQEDAPQGEEGGPFQFDLPGNQQRQSSESISIAVIQTDAAINHGNSGGALVDSKGQLIGVNVAIASSGGSEESGSIGIGFAIPSNIAKRIADEIIEDGAATHGLLGASVRDAASVEGTTQAGAYIAELTEGGAAGKAGLKADDIVTAFNGVPITGATDLTAQVRAAAAGSDATLTYVRGGKQYEIEVTLGELAG